MKVFFDDACPCNDFVREVELLQYLLKKLEINVQFLKTFSIRKPDGEAPRSLLLGSIPPPHRLLFSF